MLEETALVSEGKSEEEKKEIDRIKKILGID